MLKGKTPIATVAVKDLTVARDFYEKTLGLAPEPASESGVVLYRSGDASLLVYPSDHAGTNQATAVTWSVGDDLEAVVEALKGRGVAFEHYDFPDVRRNGDVHVGGNTRVAWFKDPDGNIHALVSE